MAAVMTPTELPKRHSANIFGMFRQRTRSEIANAPDHLHITSATLPNPRSPSSSPDAKRSRSPLDASYIAKTKTEFVPLAPAASATATAPAPATTATGTKTLGRKRSNTFLSFLPGRRKRQQEPGDSLPTSPINAKPSIISTSAEDVLHEGEKFLDSEMHNPLFEDTDSTPQQRILNRLPGYQTLHRKSVSYSYVEDTRPRSSSFDESSKTQQSNGANSETRTRLETDPVKETPDASDPTLIDKRRGRDLPPLSVMFKRESSAQLLPQLAVSTAGAATAMPPRKVSGDSDSLPRSLSVSKPSADKARAVSPPPPVVKAVRDFSKDKAYDAFRQKWLRIVEPIPDYPVQSILVQIQQ